MSILRLFVIISFSCIQLLYKSVNLIIRVRKPLGKLYIYFEALQVFHAKIPTSLKSVVAAYILNIVVTQKVLHATFLVAAVG